MAQGAAVVAVLRALVEHFADQPNRIPGVRRRRGPRRWQRARPSREAVAYVAGMTDRFAMAQRRLGPRVGTAERLPRGIDYLTGR